MANDSAVITESKPDELAELLVSQWLNSDEADPVLYGEFAYEPYLNELHRIVAFALKQDRLYHRNTINGPEHLRPIFRIRDKNVER